LVAEAKERALERQTEEGDDNEMDDENEKE